MSMHLYGTMPAAGHVITTTTEQPYLFDYEGMEEPLCPRDQETKDYIRTTYYLDGELVDYAAANDDGESLSVTFCQFCSWHRSGAVALGLVTLDDEGYWPNDVDISDTRLWLSLVGFAHLAPEVKDLTIG